MIDASEPIITYSCQQRGGKEKSLLLHLQSHLSIHLHSLHRLCNSHSMYIYMYVNVCVCFRLKNPCCRYEYKNDTVEIK